MFLEFLNSIFNFFGRNSFEHRSKFVRTSSIEVFSDSLGRKFFAQFRSKSFRVSLVGFFRTWVEFFDHLWPNIFRTSWVENYSNIPGRKYVDLLKSNFWKSSLFICMHFMFFGGEAPKPCPLVPRGSQRQVGTSGHVWAPMTCPLMARGAHLPLRTSVHVWAQVSTFGHLWRAHLCPDAPKGAKRWPTLDIF